MLQTLLNSWLLVPPFRLRESWRRGYIGAREEGLAGHVTTCKILGWIRTRMWP